MFNSYVEMEFGPMRFHGGRSYSANLLQSQCYNIINIMSESFATQYSSLIVNQPEVYLPYIESILNAKMHRIVYNNIYPCEYAVLWLCFRET